MEMGKVLRMVCNVQYVNIIPLKSLNFKALAPHLSPGDLALKFSRSKGSTLRPILDDSECMTIVVQSHSDPPGEAQTCEKMDVNRVHPLVYPYCWNDSQGS